VTLGWCNSHARALKGAFLDEEIGYGRIDMEGCGSDQGPSPYVRCHLSVVSFRHARDLLAFGYPTARTQIGLQERRSAIFQQPEKVKHGRKPFPCRDRDTRAPRYLRHLLGVLGGHGLFEPQGLERLTRAREVPTTRNPSYETWLIASNHTRGHMCYVLGWSVWYLPLRFSTRAS
jgi:hypothetical protein